MDLHNIHDNTLARLNRLLLSRARKSYYAYFAGLVVLCVSFLIVAFPQFIESALTADGITDNISFVLFLSVSINLMALEVRYRYGFTVPLYKLRPFPIAPTQLYWLFARWGLADPRLFVYVCFLIPVLVGLARAQFSVWSMLSFIIIWAVTVMSFELWIVNFFLVQEKLKKKMREKITPIIYAFILIGFYIASKEPSLFSKIPLVNLPAKYVIAFSSAEIFSSLIACTLVLSLLISATVFGAWIARRP